MTKEDIKVRRQILTIVFIFFSIVITTIISCNTPDKDTHSPVIENIRTYDNVCEYSIHTGSGRYSSFVDSCGKYHAGDTLK